MFVVTGKAVQRKRKNLLACFSFIIRHHPRIIARAFHNTFLSLIQKYYLEAECIDIAKQSLKCIPEVCLRHAGSLFAYPLATSPAKEDKKVFLIALEQRRCETLLLVKIPFAFVNRRSSNEAFLQTAQYWQKFTSQTVH